MGWKMEYKNNLWSECVSQGHLPVVVAVSGSSVNIYCGECHKVWRLAIAGRLQSVSEGELSSLDDSEWKRKVLSILGKRV